MSAADKPNPSKPAKPQAGKTKPDPRDTPAMRQFLGFKKSHPDAVLLFRMGDFYETFFDDAMTLNRELGLTLSERPKGVPMAGVPHHQLENYLAKLVALGKRVAVADQIQDPREAKGIVDRGVTRVVTPGTLVDESLLGAGDAATLAAVTHADTDHAGTPQAGAAIVDLSTGSFTVIACPADALADQLAGRGITELIAAATAAPSNDKGEPVASAITTLAESLNASITPRPAWQFRAGEALETLCAQFRVKTLEGFGLGEHHPAVPAAGAAIAYLRETQSPATASDPTVQSLGHLRPPKLEACDDTLVLDAVSLRSLEVERTIRGSHTEGSLLGVFLTGKTACVTTMGRRRLRELLVRPSRQIETITQRQAMVAALVAEAPTARALRDELGNVQDIARIASRLALGRATPRDLVALGASVRGSAAVRETLTDLPAFAPATEALERCIAALTPIATRIETACVDEPPAHLRDGGLIRDNIDPELDEARSLERDAGAWLADYQAKLIAEHDLPSLRVGFNKVFGYYIELPRAQAQRAPDILSRKQTLKNAERYVTPELKDFEQRVTTAEARAQAREKQLFDELCEAAADCAQAIIETGASIADIDALAALAAKAHARGWARPTITAEPVLSITAGRHPVLDEALDTRFVPNDCALGTPAADQATDQHQPAPPLALITGPNMAGKSTYIRQVALIALLAHAGSFVPAEAATIGVADRLFTRVGADDALHRGQSTFMVEMTETANILHHATPASIVILDEIGRGTSTLDGLSLAWAITEHLSSENLAPRTLFATHYHELTDLDQQRPGRIANRHVAVREWPAGAPDAEIVFLHRILPGRADQSYGVHVARLAGVPTPVITRAREVLGSLSVEQDGTPHIPAPEPPKTPTPQTAQPQAQPQAQLGLFSTTEYLPHPALDALREIKLESLSPLDAFDTLRSLQKALDQAPKQTPAQPAPTDATPAPKHPSAAANGPNTPGT